jgi:hypothetical protein
MVLHTSGTCRGRGTKEFSADCIVAEKNFGGALVEANLRIEDRHIPIKMVSERYDLNRTMGCGRLKKDDTRCSSTSSRRAVLSGH